MAKGSKKIDLGLKDTPDGLIMHNADQAENRLPKIYDIPLTEIDDFPNHPFKVKQDEDMEQLVESVKERGIITPITLTKKEDGRYEIISGHRRKKACELAGLKSIRSEIKELSHEEATIFMVDSNLQRSVILPSEKAFAYKMKLEVIKGKRTDLTCDQVGHKFDREKSVQIMANESSDSKTQIQRYIRLTSLIPELLDLMDEGKIAFSVGVELSYLDDRLQYDLLNEIEANDCTPSYAQSVRMHKAHCDGMLDKHTIQSIMSEQKANQREMFRMPMEQLRKYAPKATEKQLEDFVLKACEHYKKYLQRQRGAR